MLGPDAFYGNVLTWDLSRRFSTFARLSHGFRGNSSGFFDFPLKHLLFSAAAAAAAAAAGWSVAAAYIKTWSPTCTIKKFDFRESFRDAVLLGSFRVAFANLSRPAFWLSRKNVRLQFVHFSS